MAGVNFDAINQQLLQLPGYQQAVRSADRYTRGEVARRFAAAHGIQVPSGAVDEQGRFSDPNASHWYDPGKIGPLVVGGSALGVGLLGGPFAGAAAASGAGPAGGGTAASAAGPVGGIPIAYAPGAAAPNAGALGTSVAGLSPLGSLAPTVANAAGNVGGNALASSIKDKLLSPQGLAGLGASIAGLVAANRGGNTETDAATNALLQEALKRSQRVDPLHQAVTQLAFSRLPDSARNGITLTGK